MLFTKRQEVLRYVLIDTNGAVFDNLLEYSNSQYSLASLLMEMMQLNMISGDEWPYDNDSDNDDETKKKAEEDKEEKQRIQGLLDKKKSDIVGKLI